MLAIIRRAILKTLYPVLSYLGKIGIPDRRVSERFVFLAGKVLRPGHVLLTRKDWEASNVLTSDYWKHAAIYLGPDENSVPTIIESVGRGVVAVGLAKFLLTKDDVLVLKPRFADPITMRMAANEAKKLLGQPYDYQFEPTNRAWYCSEIIWWVYCKVVPHNPFTPRETLGVETVTPQDFANAKEKWEVILASKDYQHG